MSEINIKLNYDVKVNPHLFEMLNYFNYWAEKHIPPENQQDISLYDICILLSYCYPEATKQELLCFAQVLVLIMVCDDLTMEKVNNYQEVLKIEKNDLIIYNKENDKKGIDQNNSYGLLDIQLLQLFTDGKFSPFQRKRLYEALKSCFEKTQLESNSKTKDDEGVNLDESNRCIFRKKNATGIFVLLTEMISECDLSAFLENEIYKLNMEAIENLLTITCTLYNQNQLCNEIEILGNKSKNEIETEKKPIEKSIKETLELFNHWFDFWKNTSKKFIEKYPGNKNLSKYMKGIEQVIGGNLKWALYSTCFADDSNLLKLFEKM